ncbi:hypothetical protein E0H73_40875 [Kribbella pittospori]|uniref:Uncharacterized protein n=1 Tax=Kribbella pittospori TaxID=722689 RepID=A0A4R0JXT5_9ACTN|nr:SGNH/GDSL hydrolase family protein [Kribbella pittospori]TCC51477.1 hypothetical protein E0H73_40875 [Kribbella pittospori]
MVRWLGAAAVVTDQSGWLNFYRIDPADQPFADDPDLWAKLRMPAGIRTAFRTDAPKLTLVTYAGADCAPVDVIVDGALAHRLPVPPGESTLHAPLPGRPAKVEVWLPQYGDFKIREPLLVGGDAVPADDNGLRWIAYGSSITQCRTAAGPSETWPALVARQHGWQLTCLGLGAQCHLDPVIARTIRRTPAELISLCLGINIYGKATFNRRSLRPHVAGFIHTIRDQQPETPIVVTTAIRSPKVDGNRNAAGMTLAEIRGEVAEAVHALACVGDDNLHLVDGLLLLSTDEAEQLLPDGVHPSPDGYHLLADRLAPILLDAID